MRHQPSTKNQDHQKNNSNKKTSFHWNTYHLPLSTSQANKWTLYSSSRKRTWTSYWAWSKTTRCAWSEWTRYWGLSSTASNWVRNWTYYLTDFINVKIFTRSPWGKDNHRVNQWGHYSSRSHDYAPDQSACLQCELLAQTVFRLLDIRRFKLEKVSDLQSRNSLYRLEAWQTASPVFGKRPERVHRSQNYWGWCNSRPRYISKLQKTSGRGPYDGYWIPDQRVEANRSSLFENQRFLRVFKYGNSDDDWCTIPFYL